MVLEVPGPGPGLPITKVPDYIKLKN